MILHRTVRVQSFTNPNISYEVNLDSRSCSCPAFNGRSGEPCKHLLSIPGLFPPNPYPTPSEAVSAFIKAIRLRYPADAVLWLAYMWQRPPDRSRIQRRLLICSGEDNITPGVMERVGAWYRSPARRFLSAAALEVLRICDTPNWWGHPDGRAYIEAYRRAELEPLSTRRLNQRELTDSMHAAIREHQLTTGLAAFNALYERRDLRPRDFSNALLEWAEQSGSAESKRRARIYADNVSVVWLDSNFSGQAYYALFHGDFGPTEVPEPAFAKAEELVRLAQERLREPIEVPSYAKDGIHTRAGSDSRFAGIVKMMAGCCRAYEHFGRLSPGDAWLPEFTEGSQRGLI